MPLAEVRDRPEIRLVARREDPIRHVFR
jgi:hypothetical protein